MSEMLCRQKSCFPIVATRLTQSSDPVTRLDMTFYKLSKMNSYFLKAIIYRTEAQYVLVNPFIDAAYPPPKRRRVHERHIDHHPILRPLFP